MANPTAVVFALTMAVWVADVHFAPPQVVPSRNPAAVCKNGVSATPPAGVDLEIVTCGSHLAR